MRGETPAGSRRALVAGSAGSPWGRPIVDALAALGWTVTEPAPAGPERPSRVPSDSALPDLVPLLAAAEPPDAVVLHLGPGLNLRAVLDWVGAAGDRRSGRGALVVVGPPTDRARRPGRDPDRELSSALSARVRSLALAGAPGWRANSVLASSPGRTAPRSGPGTDPTASAVAWTVAFLVGDGARFVTGATIPIRLAGDEPLEAERDDPDAGP